MLMYLTDLETKELTLVRLEECLPETVVEACDGSRFTRTKRGDWIGSDGTVVDTSYFEDCAKGILPHRRRRRYMKSGMVVSVRG